MTPLRTLFPALSVSILSLTALTEVKAELTWATAPKGVDRTNGTFSKDFEVGGNVTKAFLRAASSRSGNVTLNGEALGDLPSKFDLTTKIKPGKNTLSITANENKNAPQIVAQLIIEFSNGTKQTIETGDGWMFIAGGKNPPQPAPAAIGAAYAASNDALSLFPPVVTLPAEINAPKDFKVELLHRVPKLEEGSWVAMTVDSAGRLICSDQYGDLYRVTPAPLDAKDPEKETLVEPLNTGIKGAHGLLYAFNSL